MLTWKARGRESSSKVLHAEKMEALVRTEMIPSQIQHEKELGWSWVAKWLNRRSE